MPYHVAEREACPADKPWALVRGADAGRPERIVACHATREDAERQMRAIGANAHSQDGEPRRLFTLIESKAVTDAGAGEITGLAAVYGNIDLQDDVLEEGALAKSAADWSRSNSRLPLLDWHGESIDRIIGSVTQLKSIAKGVWFRAGFTNDEQGQRARQLAKDGHLSGVSIGWLPIHTSLKMVGGKAIRAIREARLLEISLTPVPANPLAQLASVKSLGYAIKDAIGSHKTATSDATWDEGAQLRKMPADASAATFRAAAAYVDSGADPANKTSYHFWHHFVNADGSVGAASTVAASNRIGVLNGGRGGTTIPSDARQGVYNHLASHLRDAGREPPPLGGRSSLAYELWAPAMRKALEIDYEPAARAAAQALLLAYQPDNETDGVAGLADGQPTIPAAATTGTEPAGGTAEPPVLTAEQYALAVIDPGPRDDAPAGEADDLLAYSRQMLEGMRNHVENERTSGDLERLEAEINQALGRDQS